MAKKKKPSISKRPIKAKRVKPLSPKLTQLMQQATQFHQAGNLRQAEQLYKQVLSERPDQPDANQYLGTLYHQAGHAQHALPFFQKAIALDPQNPDILNNFAVFLSDVGRDEEALELLSKLTALKPRFVDGHFNKGNVYQKMRQYEKALESFKQAVALKSNHLEALNNCGNAHQELAEVEPAYQYYKKIIDRTKSNALVNSNYIFCLNYLEKLSPEEVFEAHTSLFNWPEKQPGQLRADYSPEGRATIGFVSADFYCHSVAFFFETYLNAYSRDRFKVICYYNNDRTDEVTTRLREKADGWRDVLSLTDSQLFNQIQKDKIDILVDLGGHTIQNRLAVFARRAAPVQVTWLGYANTTGVPNIDYRIVDEITDPTGVSDALNTETLVRLPNGFLCYLGSNDIDASQELPFDRNGYITFGSFNNLLKVNQSVIEAWADVLRDVPNSVLMLKSRQLSGESVKQRFFDQFEKHGISKDRIKLLSRIEENKNHLALYHEIDLCLDTFPYNGTTTTCEALWMGVPTICFEGQRHADRVSASILKHCGLDDLVAANLDGYKALAIELAGDAKRLKAFRKGLRDRMKASDLCNERQFASNMDVAFEDMLKSLA